MNRCRCLLGFLCLSGIAAAQPAEPVSLLFDFPVFLASASSSGDAQSQTEAAGSPAETAAPAPIESVENPPTPAPPDKRVFGVVPNYRSAESGLPFQPINTRQKFMIATKDSFDWPVYFTASMFTGLSQLEGSDNDVYGQGMKGFAHRYGISYADQVIGNYFPEAIVPTLLHMDPRYYRKGTGSTASRLGYAVSRIFVSRNDKGNTTFNSPEILGNALASLTTLSYHIHERTLGDAVYQWGFTYCMSDMIGQVLKEFWPDVKHHFRKNHDATQ